MGEKLESETIPPENGEGGSGPEESGEQPKVQPVQPNFLIVTFDFPGAATFSVRISGDVNPWQMAAVSAQLDEMARERMRVNLRDQLRRTAQENAQMLNARKHKKGRQTDD